MLRNYVSRRMSPAIGANLDVKVGSFAANTSTGNQTVAHGLASTPKVILFWGTNASADGNATHAVHMLGVGISSTERRNISTYAESADVTQVNAVSQQNSSCIFYASLAKTADLVSIDGTNFVINWTVAPGIAYVINYMAIGGSALTNYKLGIVTAKTSTGSQAYTGVGFQPDALMLFAGKWSTPETFHLTTNGTGLMSFVHSTSERGYVAWRSKNGANPSVAKHRQSASKVAGSLTDTGIFTEADFVSMDSDGFTLTYPTAGGSSDIMYYLALKGPQFKVGTITQPTSTGVQSTTVGFPPKGVILMSANDTTANDDATNNGQGISFGAASGTSNRGCTWFGDTHGVSPTVSRNSLDRAKAIKLLTVGATPTLNAAADLDSFGSTNFDLNWTTVDATQRELLYLAMG